MPRLTRSIPTWSTAARSRAMTGALARFRTSQPRLAIARCAPSPLQFSPVDNTSLYFATNTLWLTTDDGTNWKEISPDLSRETWELPPSVSRLQGFARLLRVTRRGVIYALGLSPLDINRLWAGTDDGLIWTTADGGAHWENVTPPAMKAFWKVFNMDAGHYRRSRRHTPR